MMMRILAPLSLHLASLHLAHSWIAVAAEFSRAASGGLVTAIWQGVLLAGLAAVALHLLPRTPAAARFAIWFGVFSLIVALPFRGFFSLAPHAAAATAAHSLPAAHGAWLTFDARWTLAIAAVWALASLVRACTLVAAAFRVRSLWKRATPVDFGGLLPGSRRALVCAQVCTSDDVDRPTVIGFFSPRILIPRWLLEKLTPAELEQVVLHEAGHLGRADDWMNLLQKIALVLFPLNPALAWVERRLCFERELACDERVLRALDGRDSAATGYASCLATLAEYRLQRRGLVHGLALALGALGRESELGRRVRRILAPAATMRPLHSRLVMGGAMLALLFAATGLERCPQVIGFAPVGFKPQLPLQNTEFANAGVAPHLSDGPASGYRAVSLRLAAPPASEWKPAARTISAVTPHAVSLVDRSASQSGITRAHDTLAQLPNTVQLPNTAQLPDADDADVVVTRWSVTAWQGAGGYRMVRTSAVVTRSLASTRSDAPQEPAQRAPRMAPRASARQTAERQLTVQNLSSYAAVPVPGGWLVFQL
jgi:beta-lactamase regulating signal transducer with metallopeptidase domain